MRWWVRSRLLVALGLLVILAVPLAAGAQQPSKVVPRIGVLAAGPPAATPFAESLRQDLREIGYVEGQNIAIEWHSAGREPREAGG